jgi:hypothetical protein
MRSLAHLCRAAVLALVVVLALPAAAPAAAGDVRVFKFADSEFDRFGLDPTPGVRDFIIRRYDRLVAFAPYFDGRTSWYRNALAYQDLYAIYSDGRTDTADKHPEWILRDAGGNRLYIPWGCSEGDCPQYAGDVGDPAFRRWWIDKAKTAMARGYRGVYIDDANMNMTVSDSRGDARVPVDERTGRAMTDEAWRRYVADFVAQLRRELGPQAEIAVNAPWHAGAGELRDRDPDVKRMLAAVNVSVLEHSVNDEGLQGGDGPWSLREFFRYIDRRHQEGKKVVLYGGGATPAKRNYSLAGYLLAAGARDAFGNWDAGSDPDRWWNGLNVSLGRARGVRYEWKGVLRRDFQRGMVLLNEPDAPTRRLRLPRALRGLDGRTRTSVTLAPRRAVVLMTPAAAAAAARR